MWETLLKKRGKTGYGEGKKRGRPFSQLKNSTKGGSGKGDE